MRNLKLTLITALAASTFAAAIPSHAITASSDIVETTIKKADLKTERGVQKVYDELKRTAESRCDVPGRQNILSKRVEQRCTERLLSDFVESAQSERLMAHHKASAER